MKLICTSDLHGNLIDPKKINELKPDVFIVAGDICPLYIHNESLQLLWIKGNFHPWLDEIKAKKIYICGNHDKAFDDAPSYYNIANDAADKKYNQEISFLHDSGCEIDGIKFWGSPWARSIIINDVLIPWPFCRDEEFLAEQYKAIPNNIDVLITHGPPYGIGDTVSRRRITDDNETDWQEPELTGSKALLDAIKAIQPKLHIYGHIHEQYGRRYCGKTLCANVSLLDDKYIPYHEPMEFNL